MLQELLPLDDDSKKDNKDAKYEPKKDEGVASDDEAMPSDCDD